MLGMRHTCCSYPWVRNLDDALKGGVLRLMDPTEVEEIQEEERYLARRLETLMEDFTKKLQEMKMPFSKFMEEYWWPRMQEVKKERDDMSVDDLQAMRESALS
ncbi:uncharacterized protein F4822DRAFT_445632 [Hypoxylon trugodes]|uniref:uncharacterized protein n=1 Tax=Hypoxylon trugodes TaxID=326681 RepID=UPI002199E967|nr:uncharacterized protein F4822DRAFT_445632 [Hypoxylon trugodes]KAI1385722.1 hypothetical protein F4822DRAFT_445632 [Hypoxylon trugodes]